MTAGLDGVRCNQSRSGYSTCCGADNTSGSLALAGSPLCLTSFHHHIANLSCLRTGVVACPFRHDSPGGTRHRVGQSHGHELEWFLDQQQPGPVGKRGLHLTRRHSVEGGIDAKHQQDAQMPVALLGDSPPDWACRRSCSVLARDRGKPCELPPTGEAPGIGYAGAEAISGAMLGMVARLTLVLSR